MSGLVLWWIGVPWEIKTETEVCFTAQWWEGTYHLIDDLIQTPEKKSVAQSFTPVRRILVLESLGSFIPHLGHLSFTQWWVGAPLLSLPSVTLCTLILMLLFKILNLHMCICVCVNVCQHMFVGLPVEARRGCWSPWSLSWRHLWASGPGWWDLDSGPHGWAACALNSGTISPALNILF